METLQKPHITVVVIDDHEAQAAEQQGGEDCRRTTAAGSSQRSNSEEEECRVVKERDSGRGSPEIKVHVSKSERDCRICHLNLDGSVQEFGVPIELGCSCKADLAAAHKHCAETWFKIKGNKTCEICGSIARNVTGVNVVDVSMERTNNASHEQVPSPAIQNITRGHRLLNFVLACMVFAFVASWLLRYNPA